MGKNQSASNLTNIIQYNNGNISFVSGSTTLMQISSSGAITTTGVISGSNALSASYAASASNALFTQTASYWSGSINNALSASYAASASNTLFAQTASYWSGSITNALSASYAASASNAIAAQTASYATAFTVGGTLTAQTLVVQTITSSVETVTGSTSFGSLLTNTHVFSGSVTMNPNGLFVSSSGNVGIGSTNPVTALDINGYGRVTGIGLNVTPTSIGTNPNYIRFTNTGGDFYIGQEGPTGSAFFNGSVAYDSVLYSGRSINSIINGVSRMYISSSGNVGIGSVSPVGKLDVYSDRNSTLLRLIAAGGESWEFKNTNTVSSTDVLSIGANGTTANLNLLDNGYVGIGTSTIPHSLTISTPTNVGSGIQLIKSGYVTSFLGDGGSTYPVGVLSMYDSGSQKVQIYAGGYSYFTGGNVGIGITNPTRKLDIISTSEQLRLAYDTAGTTYTDFRCDSAGGLLINTAANYIISYISGSEKMRITSAGDAEFKGGAVRANGGYFRLANLAGTTAYGYFLPKALWLGTGTDQSPSMAGEGGYGLSFFTNGTTAERMTITTGGNVGIGTTNPGSKLEVASSTSVATLRLNSSGGGQNASVELYQASSAKWEIGTGMATSSDFEIRDRVNSVNKLTISNGGPILLRSRATNITQGNCVNMQEWVAYGQTITAGSFINLFNIKGQYDNISGDFYAWIDQGSWTGFTCRFLIGYGGFGTTAVLGNSTSFTLSSTGTLYNETLKITNNSASNVNNSNICVRIWGRYISDGVGSGGTDLITSSYLTRIS